MCLLNVCKEPVTVGAGGSFEETSREQTKIRPASFSRIRSRQNGARLRNTVSCMI